MQIRRKQGRNMINSNKPTYIYIFIFSINHAYETKKYYQNGWKYN